MDENRNRNILFFTIILIVILAIVAYVVAGIRGIAGIFNFLKYAIIGALLIGLIVWGVWFLFIRKVRDDRVALNVKRIVDQSRITKPPTINDIFISGDIEHPQVRLGHIQGYSRVRNVKGEEEDVFVWKKSRFPFSLFEEPKAMRVDPHLHSAMVGDIVVQAISLVEHGGFFYINTDHLDMIKIDHTIKSEVIRKFTIDTLSDIKIISDIAVGISPEQTKMLEQKSLLKLPTAQQPVQSAQTDSGQRV